MSTNLTAVLQQILQNTTNLKVLGNSSTRFPNGWVARDSGWAFDAAIGEPRLRKVQAPTRSRVMNNDNVAAVRNAYAVAERKDLEGWTNLFTLDGVFVDNSVGVTYRRRALADPVRKLALQARTMARCSFPLANCLPRVSKWTPRAATCSNSNTAKSNASTAIQKGRSSLLSSGSCKT